jgi:hypothetical protein
MWIPPTSDPPLLLFPPEAHVTNADTRLLTANFVFRLYHMLVP